VLGSSEQAGRKPDSKTAKREGFERPHAKHEPLSAESPGAVEDGTGE